MNDLKPHISLDEDPDGNSWKMFVVHGDAAMMRSQPAMPSKSDAACCAPGCCVWSRLNDAAAR
ncbi:hypothetical protein BE04_25355 [Sorangium cellulosum]|uniref:Uncharacterized protein n=2 Tax=Sorangium cellulosum TaxID=56 RepID=A0A150Q5Y2_SORCE|nr:hypothetical protein [Sorangium cellulosum]AGP33847.1 hypothetical protein SCE1572_04650 [Sorangium cellulosum So0157-2]KYF63243.1 hypothetical protein BE04_25355 [Sorangium cellulosum]